MLIPSKAKITWNNVISNKPKHKNSQIKSLGTRTPPPPPPPPLLESYHPQQTSWRSPDTTFINQWIDLGMKESLCEQSVNKGVDSRSKDVTQTQQQKPESPTITLTWHAGKYKVHNSTRGTSSISQWTAALLSQYNQLTAALPNQCNQWTTALLSLCNQWTAALLSTISEQPLYSVCAISEQPLYSVSAISEQPLYSSLPKLGVRLCRSVTLNFLLKIRNHPAPAGLCV